MTRGFVICSVVGIQLYLGGAIYHIASIQSVKILIHHTGGICFTFWFVGVYQILFQETLHPLFLHHLHPLLF